MKRDSTLFIESSKGNLYIADLLKKEIFPCHKLVKVIYDLDANKNNSEERLLEQALDVYNEFEDSQIRFYVKKYLFLRKNGYFSSTINSLAAHFSAVNIQEQLENVDIVVFEVTERCNLNCAYCINGTIYNPKRRIENELRPESAHAFMEYLILLWNMQKNNTSCTKQIGFYGGEPLMNMPLIKDIVKLCKENETNGTHFEFRMTTNGTLLDKYRDYLVSNKFYLTISLDGDKEGQSYRIFSNGRNSFDKIYGNLKEMMTKYPEYWKENISFNSILHNRNSVSSIHNYIQNEFGKVPQISPLNNSGIMPDKVKLFNEMFRAYDNSEDKLIDQVTGMRFMNDPRVFNLSQFLMWNNANHFYNYKSILCNAPSDIRYMKTGTCIPFSRKIYLSAKNKIYPCERINEAFYLGEIDSDNKVILNTSDIANTFNNRIKMLYEQCSSCYLINGCYQCMYQLEGMKVSQPICRMHMSKKQMENHIRKNIDLMEARPFGYNRLLNEAAVK